MRYCVSSRQSDKILKQADEIKVAFEDQEIIFELANKYKDAQKTFIIQNPEGKEFNWEQIYRLKIATKSNLVLCLNNFTDIPKLKELDIPYYIGYPVTSFWEANGLKNLGVCCLRIGVPLLFSMDNIKKLDIPIRVIPNVAYIDGLYHKDGIHGAWIRPEDVEVYDPYIQVFEFENVDVQQEATLLDVYKNQKEWRTDINILITNLKCDVAAGRMIMPEFAQHRLNCEQKCEAGNGCHICDRILSLANPQLIEEYKTQPKRKLSEIDKDYKELS